MRTAGAVRPGAHSLETVKKCVGAGSARLWVKTLQDSYWSATPEKPPAFDEITARSPTTT